MNALPDLTTDPDPSGTLEKLPEDLRGQIGHGLYGGVIQFFLYGVDGSVAQFGGTLPEDEKALRKTVESMKRSHDALLLSILK